MASSLASKIGQSKFELIFLAIGIGLLSLSFQQAVRVEPRRFIPPPPILRHFHFGYSETMADVFWIRVVQDFAVCEKAADAIAGSNAGVACDKGWVFRMLDLVTDLAPQFKMPYYYGATNLSVLVNDREGAKIIFDKGLKQMPDSWDIAYRAAYHYMIELKDMDTAAKLLLQAGKNGAPPWVFSLAGRLYTDSGKAFLAKSVLLDALKADPEGPAAAVIKRRLKLIDEELAKSQSDSKP
jgi:tetratricopeptide (TPR) repeat protein